jgi:hypothetical protein
METVRLKYRGHKEDGLPVTFPVGVKQKSAWTKVVWASPLIDVTEDEAAYLLKDTHNWAKAEGSDLKATFENVEKELKKPKAPRGSVAKASAAAAKEKRKPGRPKEYGAPKAAEADTAPAVETPPPAELVVEEKKPRGRSKK